MKRALALCLLLAGCAASPGPAVISRVDVIHVRIPGALLYDPPPPAPPTVNRADAATEWTIRLWADDLNKSDQLARIAQLQAADGRPSPAMKGATK